MIRHFNLPALLGAALVAGCAHKPPPDFAPDPSLVAQIREIEVRAPERACPGQTFETTYMAVLQDGSRIPFETRYDKDHPPRLHVVFLDRSSNAATPVQGGGWWADRDPLLSARSGFRLQVSLLAKPSATGHALVTPSYECLPHTFAFAGRDGDAGLPGQDGPPITVRLGLTRTPYVNRLIVASIEVAQAPPVYLLADAATVPPADWIIVASHGGRGGRGVAGRAGQAGQAGTMTCPGGPGQPGGPGGSGGPGATGGRGGPITIITPSEEPFLAGLVAAHSEGGEGGPGGKGGAGGRGGAGGSGRNSDGSACQGGSAGGDGSRGADGSAGASGAPGGRPQYVTVPQREVFGPAPSVELQELLR